MLSTLRRVAAALLIALPAGNVAASGGISEISQSCATATGCFPGDAPGFPVTISSSGSYILTSNLDSSADVNVDAIHIPVADDVSLNFNGFEIAGGVTCSGLGSAVNCSPGFGDGISALGCDRFSAKNGRIRGFEFGLRAGARARIENLIIESNSQDGLSAGARSSVMRSTAYQNGFNGITVGAASTVHRCVASSNASNGINASSGSSVLQNTAYDNGVDGVSAGLGNIVRGNSTYQNEAHGIDANSGCQISDNVAYQNSGDGIEASADSSVQRNTVRLNTGFGLDLATDAAYTENTINGNTAGTVDDGVNMGANSCNGTTSCP